VSEDIIYLQQLLQRGHCCSTALVAVGLRHKGNENPELLDAMKALCGGLSSGLICGALSGAACMMTLLMPQSATNGGLTELTEWFEATYGKRCNSINCRDILGDKPIMRSMICSKIVEETYKQAKQLLIDNGYTFEER
jgi:hypothetical protein